jgi:hypothetical protein
VKEELPQWLLILALVVVYVNGLITGWVAKSILDIHGAKK